MKNTGYTIRLITVRRLSNNAILPARMLIKKQQVRFQLADGFVWRTQKQFAVFYEIPTRYERLIREGKRTRKNHNTPYMRFLWSTNSPRYGAPTTTL